MFLKMAFASGFEKLVGFYNPPRLGDAGLDLVCPQDYVLAPNSLTLIPTGLILQIDQGYVGVIHDRSSMAYKGMHVFGGVIDSAYRGQISVLIFNSSDQKQYLQCFSKIAQLIITQHQEVTNLDIVEVKELIPTLRSDKGFGSTGK